MVNRYEHTQVGYLIIIALLAAIGIIGGIMANTGINWIGVGVLVVIAAALALFTSLTVLISGEEIEARFGPGPIRKRIKLNEIESCRVVRTPWYYGWGIRATPDGILYRVSGLNAVEVKLSTGRSFLIGTDVPRELEDAINQAINAR